MKELKFHKKSEYKKPQIPNSANIFDGSFLFSTQNTAVYPQYSFVETDSEIMKINTICEKIFYKDGIIAILRNGNIEFFDKLSLEKKILSEYSEFLNEFPDDSYLENVKAMKNVFIVDNNEMIVTSKSVTYRGKVYANEIHEDGCEYFVGWKDKLSVLGNSRSFNFMYFLDGVAVEPEEYHPLCVRTDEDSFESIPLDCIRIWDNQILLIDNQMISVFDVSGYEIPSANAKPIVEYTIQNDKIIQLDDGIKFIKPAPEILPFPAENTSLTNNDTSLDQFSSIKSVLQNKSTSVDKQPKNENNEIEKQISEIDRLFNSRIEKLRNGFKKINEKECVSRNLVFLPSKYDLNGLYNSIFRKSIEEYNDALSSMIVYLESMKSVSDSNILESIKFFDSRIFLKSPLKRSVNYNAPLCKRFDDVLKISNPLDDLVKGIKILELESNDDKIDSEPRSSIEMLRDPIKFDKKEIAEDNKIPKNLDGQQSELKSNLFSAENVIAQQPSNPKPSLFSTGTFFNTPVENQTQNISLFGSIPQNIPNSLVVNDTSSLFNNIASKPLNSIASTFQQPTQNDNKKSEGSDAPVSAFNRLAGSRKLFQ